MGDRWLEISYRSHQTCAGNSKRLRDRLYAVCLNRGSSRFERECKEFIEDHCADDVLYPTIDSSQHILNGRRLLTRRNRVMGVLGCCNSSSCPALLLVLVPIACENIPGPIKENIAVVQHIQGRHIRGLICGVETIRCTCLTSGQTSANSLDLYVLNVVCTTVITIPTLVVISITDGLVDN